MTPLEAIKALQLNHWTQADIAMKVNSNQATISGILNGREAKYKLGCLIVDLGYKHGNLKPARKVTK